MRSSLYIKIIFSFDFVWILWNLNLKIFELGPKFRGKNLFKWKSHEHEDFSTHQDLHSILRSFFHLTWFGYFETLIWKYWNLDQNLGVQNLSKWISHEHEEFSTHRDLHSLLRPFFHLTKLYKPCSQILCITLIVPWTMRMIYKICEQGLDNFVRWKNDPNKVWRSCWVETLSYSWVFHLKKFGPSNFSEKLAFFENWNDELCILCQIIKWP